jgi:DNA transformation protein
VKSDSFQAFVLDQLAELAGVESRAMFGGRGLYCGKTFFGIVLKGRLYFKTTAATRADYTSRGMKPFRPSAKQTSKRYHEVPAEILEDRTALAEWAGRAIAAGQVD